MSHRLPEREPHDVLREVDELFDQALEESAGESGSSTALRRLARLVGEYPVAANRYVDHVEMHLELEERFGEPAALAGELPPASPVKVAPQAVADRTSSTSILKMKYWREHRAKFASLALALTLLFWVGFYFVVLRGVPVDPGVDMPQAEFIARVSGGSNLIWASDAEVLVQGAELAEGQRIGLNSGVLEITFGKEAVVLLQGPAELIIDSGRACSLEQGKLVATAETEKARGFLVSTPLAQIVDLGTRFGVSSSESAGTTVKVIQGTVDAIPRAGARPQPRRLSAGQVATLSSNAVRFELHEESDSSVPEFVEVMPAPLPGVGPVRVTCSVLSEGNHPPEKLIDGSGLLSTGELGSRRHLAATFDANDIEDQINYWLCSWGQEPVVLTFDLGDEYELNSLWIWNYYSGGIADARQVTRIRYSLSSDGENFIVAGESAVVSGNELHPRSSDQTVEGQSIPLAGEARYVRIEILDIARPDDSREAALGEVRFEGVPIQGDHNHQTGQ